MTTGIGASITSIVDGTTAHASDVIASLNSLNSSGVSNDGGTITTSGSGIATLVGLILGSGRLQLYGTPTDTKNGSTSGTMRVIEYFVGPDSTTSNYLRLTLLRYSGYKNAAASANTITLAAPFTTFAWMIGGAIQGTQFLSGGSAITLKAITTLGGTSDGTGTSTTTLYQYSIAEAGAFTQIKEPGSNANTYTGNIMIVGM